MSEVISESDFDLFAKPRGWAKEMAIGVLDEEEKRSFKSGAAEAFLALADDLQEGSVVVFVMSRERLEWLHERTTLLLAGRAPLQTTS